MTFALLCTIDPEKLELFEKHRADHYRYLIANRGTIVFGGPARAVEGGPPETMIIIVDTPTAAAAQGFIANEPYNRAGSFSHVSVRPWSRVLPENEPGALEKTLASL